MAHDFVGRDSLDQRYLIISLEVTYLLLDLANDLEIVHTELQLRVYIDLIRNLTQRITHHKNITSLKCCLQVNLATVLHKESYSRLVLRTFQVNVTRALLYLALLSASVIFILYRKRQIGGHKHKKEEKTYVAFDVRDNSDESHLLFFHTLRDQVKLVQLSILRIGAHKATGLLLFG